MKVVDSSTTRKQHLLMVPVLLHRMKYDRSPVALGGFYWVWRRTEKATTLKR
jgi:hypothetical protein